MKSMTPQPVHVNPELAILCRGVSEADVEQARKKEGPHANTMVRIYMNDLAADAFKQSASNYAVGAVIVKEKQEERHFDKDWNIVVARAGVGGMVKRAAGFDAEHGDWEYFYFEDPAKIESGKIASCVACHAGASRDNVFGSWANDASPHARSGR